jgi:hypothetical protein
VEPRVHRHHRADEWLRLMVPQTARAARDSAESTSVDLRNKGRPTLLLGSFYFYSHCTINLHLLNPRHILFPPTGVQEMVLIFLYPAPTVPFLSVFAAFGVWCARRIVGASCRPAEQPWCPVEAPPPSTGDSPDTRCMCRAFRRRSLRARCSLAPSIITPSRPARRQSYSMAAAGRRYSAMCSQFVCKTKINT